MQTPQTTPPTLSVQLVESQGRFALIALRGHLDLDTSEILADVMDGILNSGYTQLLFDGTKLTYMSSDGVGVLVANMACCRDFGGDVKLAGFHDKAITIIELLGLHHLLGCYQTVEEGRQAFLRGDPPPTVPPCRYVATRAGKAYHLNHCRHISKARDLQEFESSLCALKRGLRPCKTCAPETNT